MRARHRALAADLEALRPKVAAADDLVFPSPPGLMLDLHSWRDRVWKPAASAAGVEAGHPRGCASRYAHAFAEAQLGASVPVTEAIAAGPR